MRKRPLVIGFSGKICSGKTYMSELVKQALSGCGYSVNVVLADRVAHELYNHDNELKQKIRLAFSDKVFDQENNIQRAELGQIVFSDKAQLEKLNALVWPKISMHIQSLIDNSTDNVTIVEAAILQQSSWEKLCDLTFHFVIPESVAKERALHSRSMSNEKFAQIWKAQDVNERIASETKQNRIILDATSNDLETGIVNAIIDRLV